MLDLHVFTFNLTAGKELSTNSGLFVSTSPKHPARGRENELLVMLFSPERDNSLTGDAQQEILSKLAGAYFKTAGTVTHALKAIAEQMNERLMARNVRQQREGGPVLGSFSAGVLRGNTFFIAHAGPNHSFILKNDEVEDFQEDLSTRNLGTAKAVSIRYYRSEVKPGELAIMSAYAPASWNSRALMGSPQLNLDQLRRRLLIQTGMDLHFILLRFEQGRGEIQIRQLRQADSQPAQPSEKLEPETAESTQPTQLQPTAPEIYPPARPEISDAQPAQGIFLSGDRYKVDETLSSPTQQIPMGPDQQTPISSVPNAEIQPAAAARRIPIEEPPDFPPHMETADDELAESSSPWAAQPVTSESTLRTSAPTLERGVRRRRVERGAKKAVTTALRSGRGLREKWAAFLRRFLPRVLPGQGDKLPTLSPAVLVFIAIAVPLIIVAAATTVYIQNGRTDQHRTYLAQAQAMLDQANATDDITLRRVNMEAALEWIDKADSYGVSQESISMKNKIESTLDSIEGIRRMDLQLALPGGFDNTVRITRIVANQAEDLFALDAANGRVYRLVYTRPGYEVDTQFTCGPGMIGSLIIGPLIDIAVAPLGNTFGAAIVGLDASGNMIYCSNDPTNTLAVTLPPPDAGWGRIIAISVDSAAMHVLDSGANAVWRYEGFNLDYLNPPRLYFDNDVPDLSSAIDLIQNRDELFVLYSDGHMLMCTYSNVSTTPTRCKNPYPYQVALTGQSPQEVVSLQGQFERLQLTQPPEPSIYMLDSSGPAVYQFSLALNFVSKIMPAANGERLPAYPPTAFTVTLGRNLILAFGNQLYMSPLPAP